MIAGALCAGKPRPILAHPFSAGGFAVWTMFEMISGDFSYYRSLPGVFQNLRPLFCGVIWDSCPINIEPSVGAFATAAIFADFRSTFAGALALPLELVMRFWWRFWQNVDYREVNRSFWDHLTRLRTPMPQLFFYSKTDVVTKWRIIEAHVARLRADGVPDVYEKCWARSRHVQHYKDHTAEYEGEIRRFFDLCIKGFRDRCKSSAALDPVIMQSRL
mmetsp:Transcript_31741/g.51222  ORF Transcript_31741/g.51222 Transcript_31741/m.51222 type:complete len:217 (+) Transcript_31741:251-901(+)